MTPSDQPLRNQQPLDLLDNWYPLDNLDALDNRDALDNWEALDNQNPSLLSLPFALPWSILLQQPIPHLEFALPSLQVLKFALSQFALSRFALSRFALSWFALFRFALFVWQTPWVDCLVVGCRVWMITTHRQNGWHIIVRSGTTVQFTSPTLLDTVMMMKILPGLWISGGHV